MTNVEKYRANADATVALMDAGIVLMRENFVRRHPSASIGEIDVMLDAWLRRAESPIPGDTAGMVRIRERRL